MDRSVHVSGTPNSFPRSDCASPQAGTSAGRRFSILGLEHLMKFELATCGMPDAAIREGELPTLLCLSHLRWNFVYQRPQHLLSRAARHYNTIFFEEPVFEQIAAPKLKITAQPNGITIAVPVLPCGLSPGEVAQAQRVLLDELLGPFSDRPLVTWYYTPYALTFSEHLEPSLCIYDNMDELSAFRGASPELIELEKK